MHGRREEIVDRVWGKNVFLDTDNGNFAIRKSRQLFGKITRDSRIRVVPQQRRRVLGQ